MNSKKIKPYIELRFLAWKSLNINQVNKPKVPIKPKNINKDRKDECGIRNEDVSPMLISP